jgi:hypothetical protein
MKQNEREHFTDLFIVSCFSKYHVSNGPLFFFLSQICFNIYSKIKIIGSCGFVLYAIWNSVIHLSEIILLKCTFLLF